MRRGPTTIQAGAHRPDWRAGVALSVLVAVLLALLVTPRLEANANGPSVIMNSRLLDWDLPGTAPAPDPEGALTRLRDLAERHALTCGPTEVYQTDDPALLATALGDAQAERHYLRYKDKAQPTMSQWDGPRSLLMLETAHELLLCEVLPPIRG